VRALAEVELVPFWYVVEDASLTVTFCPADVVTVKLDVVMLLIVPTVPPAAGPERAFDPPPDPKPPAAALLEVAEGDVAVAEEDVAEQPASAIAAHVSPAAAIHPLLLFDSTRRTLGRRARLAVVAGADESGEYAGGADVSLETGRAGSVSCGLVGS
jgi:hypothetical protein